MGAHPHFVTLSGSPFVPVFSSYSSRLGGNSTSRASWSIATHGIRGTDVAERSIACPHSGLRPLVVPRRRCFAAMGHTDIIPMDGTMVNSGLGNPFGRKTSTMIDRNWLTEV
jgi:hypothetical protein